MQTLHDANDTFLHLLQTFTVLMSERSDDAELDGKTTSQCDEELRTLRSVQKSLERRVALVSRKRNTFTRINTLPPELLVDIFDIAIDKSWSTVSVNTHAILSLVCRYWNHLVDTTPSLWTNISAGSHVPMTKILRALQKSQNAPLEIGFASWGVEKAEQNAFLNAIFLHAHRWRELKLWLEEDVQELETMTTLSTPLLEHLLLSFDMYAGWFKEQPLDLFRGQSPPNLRRLYLRGIPISWSPTVLCHLTALDISQIRSLGPSFDQLLAVLSACPDMESLSIREVSFSGGVSTSPPNPTRIYMSALGRLELHTLGTDITNRLLASIHAPSCITGEVICQVLGDPLEALFTSDVSHFLGHIRSNPSAGSISCEPGRFRIYRMGPWQITLDVDNITFAKDTLIWLSSPSPLHLIIYGIGTSLADILLVTADTEALYRISLGYDAPASDALTLLATYSSMEGRTRWPFPGLVEMSIGSGIVDEDWEALLLMLRRRQGVLETQGNAQHPKPLHKLELGSDWAAGADDPVIADFSSTYWPNHLDDVRRLLGPEGKLIWYGRMVTEEGVLEDRVGGGAELPEWS